MNGSSNSPTVQLHRLCSLIVGRAGGGPELGGLTHRSQLSRFHNKTVAFCLNKVDIMRFFQFFLVLGIRDILVRIWIRIR
jgi:hypothetical protein